ncbi:DMT family transporter [Paracoccus aerodenitrificans]|uniref:DMT family transporter n=1 Tax=Paracoccus aerodenitrificans TaxID=3017781 RepID=UPI0022EFF3AE|nr:multidrug efflux SMR transporter [Paracoccus aerodenitrificans]WBU62874.1 multidrug efflux SMR transporter [Paracoccus aerodenitrificans]
MIPVWGWLGGAILLEVIGTTALQQSAQFTRIVPTLVMAVCYGLSFYALSVVVQTMPMGVVYAIWSGTGIALISLIGVAFLNQHLDAAGVIGIALIAAGVVIINMFSSANPH